MNINLNVLITTFKKKKKIKLIFKLYLFNLAYPNVVILMCSQHKHYYWDILHYFSLDQVFEIWYVFYNSATAAAAAKSLQSCPTHCDPIDGSPPGSPVPGILQARTLEWVSISFSSA